MSKEVIHVGLYGGKGLFGGKETALEASIVQCDKFDKCSFFKADQCACVRSMSSITCPFGIVRNEKGYTSKARKYYEFKSKWKEHEKYGKLKSPPCKLGLIDDVVIFPYAYVNVEKEDGKWVVNGPRFFDGGSSAIPLTEFTVELIRDIVCKRPQALMGGEISSYQAEVVPKFISHLKEVLPEKYEEFVAGFPGYEQKIDYVGRKAILTTLSPSAVEYKANRYSQFNEIWYWDGKILTFTSGHVGDFGVTKHYEVESVVIRPSEKSVVTISDNNQVNSNTIFVD
ncbi:hypothetical protein [Paenibacillus pinihumi]|uniref:hypothetical protein n=1 Tax=Paenibacillus pinihumi TaxID=669462 RepID=UPI0012B61067|nr:hypothetical protein [Paenibacillus pinihumi]